MSARPITPNRPRPTGTGRIDQITLTCGHPAKGQPAFRQAGVDHHSKQRWWCDECAGFKGRK